MVLAVLALAGLALYAGATDVAGWEVAATRTARSWPDTAGVVLRPAIELGNRLVALGLAVVVGARWGWRRGVAVAIGVVGASVLAGLLKGLVERPRIGAAALEAAPRRAVEGFSFPSSHAAISFALVIGVALAARAPARWVAVAVAAGCLTAVGRMWLGVHYPLDVLGGALLGTTCALVAAQLVAALLVDPDQG